MPRASVIPVMVHPRAGPFILLGRNRAAEGWSGASCWSDFGGQIQASESAEAAAAREIAEESIETLVKFHEQDIFRQSLLDHNYMCKFEDQFNVVFAVRFDWDPSKLHEFTVMRRVLASLSKLARGLGLTEVDQAQLGKFRWFCKDKRLNDILAHPAIESTQQIVTAAQSSAAQTRLAQALGIRSQPPSNSQTLIKVRVIQRIADSWLEKDQVQLFSIPVLRKMLSLDSVTCRGTACSRLDPAVIPWLQAFTRLFCFQMCMQMTEAQMEESEQAN